MVNRQISGEHERIISEFHSRYALDKAFYERVRTCQRTSVADFLVEPFSGKASPVKAGQTFRVVLVDGPQVVDVGVWNLKDPSETVSAARTIGLNGWFIQPYGRVWSDEPTMRPLVTCVDDTVAVDPPDARYHHHFVLSHCSPELHEYRTGIGGLNACHLNLLEAVEPYGLDENNIRDNINVHQKFRLDETDGRFYGARSNGRPGDFVEFYAEIDLLVAVSVCPNGDNSRHFSLPDDPARYPLHTVRFDIFDTGIAPKEFPKWTDWRKTWNRHQV